MDMEKSLESLLQKQREVLSEIDHLSGYYKNNSVEKENEQLKQVLQKRLGELDALNKKYDAIYKENQDLRLALREQILNEKLNILKISRDSMEAYFSSGLKGEKNKLAALETTIKLKTQALLNAVKRELKEDEEALAREFKKMDTVLHEKIKERKAQLEDESKQVREYIEKGYEVLREEDLDEEVIKKRIKQNNVEVKIGLNLINRIGIGLILLGVATAAKYTYSAWLNDYVKAISMFALGILFFVGGEWFARKEKDVFSLGLSAGGTGILYFAVFNSYFILNVLNMNAALILSILVTVVTVLFSLRYNSRTICAFALIGGYLPFFSYVLAFGLSDTVIIAAMGYLLLLNSALLAISLYKKWSITEYLSFLLNVPVLIYLVIKCDNDAINIAYTFLTFAMYLSITLGYSLKNKVKLKIPDIILLGLNTYISCILIYQLFEEAGLKGLRGILAIAFCAVYFGLGQFIEKRMQSEKNTRLLFYVTSLAFAILTIPFQFGMAWVAMGWIVESVILIFYSRRVRNKALELGGWIVFALCYAAFFYIDLMMEMAFIHLKFTMLTAAMLLILYLYLKNADKEEGIKARWINAFKYITVVHTWIYFLYEALSLYDQYTAEGSLNGFYGFLIFATVTALYAYGIRKVKLVYDGVIRYISMALLIIVNLACLFINVSLPVLDVGGRGGSSYIALALLVGYNIFAFFSVKDIVIDLISRKKYYLELYPMILAVYMLLNITSVLVVQSGLENINFIISVTYMLLALLFIVYGFRHKYNYIRRFGLGLTVFANLKLFMWDLRYLDVIWRIAAFFAFGFIMLGISFVYQRLKKKMEGGKPWKEESQNL